MDAFFVTAVTGLRVKSDLGRGEKLDASIFITNNKSKIKKELTETFIQVIGRMEFNNLLKSDMIIYSKETIPKDLTPEQFLISKLYHVEKFHNALWMLKDNCANNELGFLFYHSNGTPVVSSNFIAIVNSTALGKTSQMTEITRSELKIVSKFIRENIDIGNVYSLPTTQLIKGHDRISRAYYLVQAARAQSDIAIKISNYCNAFESIFATSSIELTHKLSERIAYLLNNDISGRIETFKFMKKAYGIRSKIVHGDVIKKSFIEELKEVSEICDSLIRQAMIIVLRNDRIREIFLGTPDQIDEFFVNLLFGKNKIDEYFPNKIFYNKLI